MNYILNGNFHGNIRVQNLNLLDFKILFVVMYIKNFNNRLFFVVFIQQYSQLKILNKEICLISSQSKKQTFCVTIRVVIPCGMDVMDRNLFHTQKLESSPLVQKNHGIHRNYSQNLFILLHYIITLYIQILIFFSCKILAWKLDR